MNADGTPHELVKVIDNLMEELDELAASPHTSSNELFARAIDTLAAVVQPAAAAVFLLGPNGLPINSTSAEPIDSYFPVWPTAEAELATSPQGLCTFTDTRWVVLGLALQQASALQGVLVAKLEPTQHNKATLALMKAVADLISRFVGKQITLAASGNLDFLSRVNEFSLGCLSSIDERELGKIIANDARTLMGCERVQLFKVNGARLALAAVSSVATFEKRTELLRASHQIAKMVGRRNTPLLSSQTFDDPKVQAIVEVYRELAGMPFFAVFPLQAKFRNRKPDRPNGVLFAEYSEPPQFFEFVRAAKIVIPQASLATFNAQKISSIPFHKSLMFFSNHLNLGSVTKLLIGVGLPLTLLSMAFLIPIDFKIRMNGTLRPVNEQLVFSPHDAFVENVLVEHGAAVAAGKLLVELRSPALNLELEEVISETKKITEFKAAKTISLNQTSARNADDPALQAKLASEIEDLEFQINTLHDKQTYIQRRLDELNIYAPIAGRVVTWNVKKLLQEKPVRWGDPLLKIADEAGDWELRFQAAEKKIGYIMQAQANTSEANHVPVKYFFQSNPEQKFSTVIRNTADSTELDAEVGPSVTVICDIDAEQMLKRHGAKVVGDVFCGKRSIAYVWTYELVDAVRRQFVW